MSELVFNIDNTSLETVKSLKIAANFDEMEAALKELIEPYKNLVVTEDGIPQAKTDRAKIRKVSNNIEDHRKLVKKVYSEPLKVFEDNCKRLTAVCAEGINNLDEQIKDYENRAKAKKLKELEDYFDSLPKKHPEFTSFAECENPKWMNLTYSFEDAQNEILNYVTRVETDVDAIKALNSKYELPLLDEYRKTGNVSSVLMLKNRMEESERLAEQRRAEAEQRRMEAEQRRTAEAEARARMAEEQKASPAPSMPEQPVQKEEPANEADAIPNVIYDPPHKFIVTCHSLRDQMELMSLCAKLGISAVRTEG